MDLATIKLMVSLHCSGHLSAYAVEKLLSEKELTLYAKLLTAKLKKEKS